MTVADATGRKDPFLERCLFIYAPILFFVVFLIGPFYWMAITAVSYTHLAYRLRPVFHCCQKAHRMRRLIHLSRSFSSHGVWQKPK